VYRSNSGDTQYSSPITNSTGSISRDEGEERLSFLLIIVALLASMVYFGILLTPVYAFKETRTSFQDGYNRGLRDGERDAAFNDSCPSHHTPIFCSGYRIGYAEGFNANPTFLSQEQTSGVNIDGNNNRAEVNQGQSNNDRFTGNGDGNGQLFRCKILCVGIQ
jgi:hypothetical protein